MGPNPPEQNPPEKSMAQQAQEAADRALAQIREIRSNYESKFADLKNIQDDGERARAREALAREAQQKLGEEIRKATSETEVGQVDTPEIKKQKADNAKRIFLEAKELNKEGINVVDNKSQLIVDKIVEKIKSGEITDENTLTLEKFLGKHLINGVVFSQGDQPASDFETDLENYLQVDPQIGLDIARTIGNNPETYGITLENFSKKIGLQEPENNQSNQGGQPEVNEMDRKFLGDYQYYQSRFTENQLEVISTFYSPEAFVGFMEKLENGNDNGSSNFLSTEKVQNKKQDIEHHVREYYEKNPSALDGKELETTIKTDVAKHWAEIISEDMNWKVSDVINQIFLELQQKSPHKFYEEIMQGDPFYGPMAIQNKIQTAINSLMTKVAQIESSEKDSELKQRLKNLNLYRHAEQDRYVDERNGKTYPRLKPIPYGKKISTSDFIKYVGSTVDHTIHKAEYFHNSRAIYGHPAGEKGFYNQLGGFAESLKGTDIDEILMLPDGQHIMHAYQLYEKMLEEDFASLDWRHRPDQFQNELERVNNKLEGEIINQLKSFYPELTETRITNIVNSAVGISRGMFLTESEKSAYADPVDANGQGMVASYSTNDAQSLNVFNPLHNALRWQGEHNWNMMYFMPVGGQKGSWDHKKAWDNMAGYMDTFIAGKGRNKKELPELFADAMTDINKVGGPNKRKGWRMSYSLDGHFEYDDDGTINAPKTFRAMEAIGYEGIANFITMNQLGEDLLKATENTSPKDVAERKEMFKYIYKKYFSEDPSKFQESDLDNYLAKLRIKGEENALKKIKKNKGTTSYGEKPIIEGSWEEQVAYETSQLFMKHALTHYVAARMPTKFLRIDRNRFTENGVSRWERTYKEMNKEKSWSRAEYDHVMKDLALAETLLRKQISEQIRQQISFNKDWKLSQIKDIEDLPSRLNEKMIQRLLENKADGKSNFKEQKDIDNVIALWRRINQDYKEDKFLDGEAVAKIEEYKFTFGLEDTDISLIPYRGTGPRMIARAIKDIGGIEAAVTPWLMKMPDVLSEIAVSGKHDFTPIIEYLRQAKKAINDVHGSEAAQEFMYKVSGTVINYFKKDGMAKPLFGLFRLGQRNSIAAEYAGRSSAVWEWDSRDIDRFCVALESYRLIPLNPYDSNKTERATLDKKTGKWIKGKFIGGQLEDRWIKLPFLTKPIRFGKRRHVDFEFNGAKLRREHGADWKAISWDMVNQFLPLAMAFLLWKYIKDAMDEASGKKKQ